MLPTLKDVKQDIAENGYSVDALWMLRNFLYEMAYRGLTLDMNAMGYAATTFEMWSRFEPMALPGIIAAPPGFGKSTMLEVFLDYMTDAYPDTFGAIVVKEKREQVMELVNALNRYGEKKAYGIYGKDFDGIDDFDYRTQFTEQEKYPILVITKAMFEVRSSNRTLRRLMYFEDWEGRTRRRTHLFIDERPELIKTFEVTPEQLTSLLKEVRRVMLKRKRRLPRHYKRVLDTVDELRGKLEKHRTDKQFHEELEPIDERFRIPQDLRKAWMREYDNRKPGEEPAVEYFMLDMFESAVRLGGIVKLDERNGTVRLTVGHRLDYEWTAFNPFILDATGDIDAYYKGFGFPVLEYSKDDNRYKNVSILVNNQYLLSKNHFEKYDREARRCIKMMRDEILPKYKKTMVVVYKEMLPHYEKGLAEEIRAGKVALKHFDSGRGSNAYRDCDAAVFLGTLFKGEDFYPSAAAAAYDKPVKIAGNGHKVLGYKYEDETAEEFKIRDMTVDRVQDIHRLRPWARQEKIDVYLFHTDDRLINSILKEFPGAEVEQFFPKQKLKPGTNGKMTSADRFIEYIRDEMNPGEKVKAKYIYESVLGINRAAFNKMLAKDEVKAAMEEYGVEKQGHSYVKREQEITRVDAEGRILARNAAGEWIEL